MLNSHHSCAQASAGPVEPGLAAPVIVKPKMTTRAVSHIAAGGVASVAIQAGRVMSMRDAFDDLPEEIVSHTAMSPFDLASVHGLAEFSPIASPAWTVLVM